MQTNPKTILITGTSKGIGYALAKFFAKNGHQVLALSRNNPIEFSEAENIKALNIDISEAESLDKLPLVLDTFKPIDAIIHNAGAFLNKPFAETTLADFQNIYATNVFAVAKLTQICLPYMQKSSHCVAISSMGGIQGSMKFAGLSAYSSSKGALITLMELLAEEYKTTGIAFNTLALGAVQTEMLAKAFPDYQAPLIADEMANYIYDFALNGHKYYNGKVLQVSSTTP